MPRCQAALGQKVQREMSVLVTRRDHGVMEMVQGEAVEPEETRCHLRVHSESPGVPLLRDGCDRGTAKGTRAEHPPGRRNISKKLQEKVISARRGGP